MMKKMKMILILIAGVAALWVTACNANIVNGSGDVISETRNVADFDSIALNGTGEVIITQSGRESLTIETDDNVVDHVKSEVKDGTLILGFEEGPKVILPTRLNFSVGVDDLTSVRMSGSGDIKSDTIETDRLNATVSGSGDVQIGALIADEVEARISGSGEIELAGEATTQDVTISGSGNYRAGDLQSESVEVKISGSGDVQIGALIADEVEARISGSGEIELAGETTTQDVTISGSGNYRAGDLRSESVKVKISGSGDATVWATDSLETNIGSSGSVNYHGRPSVSMSGSGSGKISSLGEK